MSFHQILVETAHSRPTAQSVEDGLQLSLFSFSSQDPIQPIASSLEHLAYAQTHRQDDQWVSLVLTSPLGFCLEQLDP